MSEIRRRQKSKVTAVILIVAMIFSMVPASIACAADSGYDYQPEGADNSANSLKMLEPSNINLLTVGKDYYLNEIGGEIDGTKNITFTFALSAGMNNFNQSFFLSRNMPLIKIYDEKEEKVVAEYSNGNGTLKFLGSYQSDEMNPHGGNKTTALDIGLDQGVLPGGTYVLVFDSTICGNNEAKQLRMDIKFRFKVKAVPELKEMIRQAQDFLGSVTVNDSGRANTYPQAAADTLQAAINAAKNQVDSGNEDAAAEELYKALQAFKETCVVIVSDVKVKGVDESAWVGDKGNATADVTVAPDEDQYKQVTWSCSDNLTINQTSGAWQVNYKSDGMAWIKATSVKDPSQSATYTFTVKEDPNYVTINLYSSDLRLEKALTNAGYSDLSKVTGLKLFTSNNGELTNADFSLIRENLTNLQKLNIKNVALTDIGNSAFSGKTTLKEIILPDTLNIIQPRAFYNCRSLSKIEIPAAVTSIGSGAFAGCTSLPNQLTVWAVCPPDYATSGTFGSAFNGDANKYGDPATPVKSILVPYSCAADYKAKQGWRAFTVSEMAKKQLKVSLNASGMLATKAAVAMNDQGIASESEVSDLIITSPAGIQLSRLEDINGFLQAHFLNTTTIDLSGTEFEDNKCNANTFKDRISLKKIILPDSTETIGGTCFAGCKNLSSIVLPSGLTNMGAGAFNDCGKLGDTIAIEATTPPTYDGTIFPDNITTIAVPPQAVSAYKKATGWSQYAIISRIGMAIDKMSVTLQVPSTATIIATPTVYNGDPDDVTVKWTSSNASVASVDKSIGKTVTVTARKAGTAIITASDVSGTVKATCTVKATVFPAPTAKAASAAYNANQITWSAVTGASGYELYRATSKNGSYEKLKTLSASTKRYTDAGLSTGKAYYYKVRAYKTVNGTTYRGDYSAVVSAKPKLNKVSNVKTKKSGKQKIKVSWKKVSGASGYEVYQSLKKSKSYKKVKTIKKGKTVAYATKKLKKNKKYYFKVRAYRTVNGKKVYGAYSSVVSRKAK